MNVTVTQILRPVKLAILIQPNKKNSYVRALQICSCYWGGKHFPIIPLYKKFTTEYRKEYHLFVKSPVEFYKNVLDNFNPDVLVIDEGLDENYIKSIRNNRAIVSIAEIEESLSINESRYGISIVEILESIQEREFKYERTDGLRVSCPRIGERDLFTMTMCGRVNFELLEKIKGLEFPEKYVSFPRVNKNNLERGTGKDILNYLSLSTYQTEAFGSSLWTFAYAIYIVKTSSLNDILNIWNYRALGWNILAIPEGSLNEPYYQAQIAKQQAEFHQYTRLHERIQVMANRELNREAVHEYLNQLSAIQSVPGKNTEYIHQWWFPRYWEKGEYLRYDRAAAIELRSSIKQTTLTAADLKVQVPIERPIFKRKYVRHIRPRYINEVLLQFDEMEGKYAQILPELPTKEFDLLIKGSGYGQWIFSEGVLHFLAQENDEYLSLYIPRASDVFKKWFAEHTIEIRHSPPGKLGNQLLKNIGGIYGANFLSNPGILPVLSHFENGKTVLQQTLEGELAKQINLGKFRDTERQTIIAKLLDKSIIEFGAEVQCNFCNQRSFHKVSDFAEKVKCPICQNTFIIPSHKPSEIKWAYRGMGPFSRNNKADGLLCVLLLLRFFKVGMHPSYLTPLMSFELVQNNVAVNEVDLGVFYAKDYSAHEPPDLFLAECKTEIDFEDKDVEKMKKLGLLFPGAVLTFATLKPVLSDVEKERIGKLASFFRKGLGPRPVSPVLVLTANELVTGSALFAFEAIKHRFIDHLRFSDEINHLCDITCQHYLDLPSFGTITEERLEKKRKAWGENRKVTEPVGEEKGE